MLPHHSAGSHRVMSANSPPLQLRVFLASPSDVEDERKAARDLTETVLPKDPLLPCRVTFEVVAWDIRPRQPRCRLI